MEVLFCSNEMRLTGAPLILFDIIQGLKDRGLVKPVVYCTTDGPMVERFKNIGVPVVQYLDWKNTELLFLNTVINHRLIQTASAKKIPSIWVIHESQPNLHYPEQKELISLLKNLQLPKKVVFQSHCTAHAYGKYAPGKNFTVIPGAVNITSNTTREKARCQLGLTNELCVLTIGTIEKRKGQEDIAAALSNTSRAVRWYVVGRKVDEIPLDPRMVIIEPTEDVWKYYRAADVYACTSRVESYPRTILEALAHDLPIVTTPVYGIKEQVNGVFYKPGDTQDLWEKIDNCLKIEQPKHWSVEEMIDAYALLLS
jgi:glycosyltransferase involved in cell wall biosynthesis